MFGVLYRFGVGEWGRRLKSSDWRRLKLCIHIRERLIGLTYIHVPFFYGFKFLIRKKDDFLIFSYLAKYAPLLENQVAAKNKLGGSFLNPMPAPTCADFFGIVSGALPLLILMLHYFAYHTPLVKDASGGGDLSGERSDATCTGEG
jgi:hypothetical protein